LPTSDDELVPRLRRGDAEAFRLLVDRFGDDLFRLACSTLGSEADACDLVQETLVGAFRGVARFDGRSSLRTWLLRILFNQASKVKRSRRLRQAVPLHAVDGSAGASGAGADRTLLQAPPQSAVDAGIDAVEMLQTLSSEHRQVLVLREIQRLSYGEIAAALGVPVGTVESRLHRARQDLLRRFPRYGEENSRGMKSEG
jgi:RNA polymerase sigma-70 factor (ECF subfamily)